MCAHVCICMYLFTCSGVELMKKYQEEVAELEANRQELTNAERLFELPITMYPELLKVQKEMKGLEQIYAIYIEQKVCEQKSFPALCLFHHFCHS